MKNVLLKIVAKQPAPQLAWSSELWSDGNPVAGGETLYTQGELEAPLADGRPMTQAVVLEKIRTQDAADTIFREIGLRLYQLLEKTGTAKAWRALRDTEEQAGGGLRTYLELPVHKDAYIDEWPWELLACPDEQGDPVMAFTRPLSPILRGSPKKPLQWRDSTVRILLVSGQDDLDPSDPGKPENLAVSELRLIRRVFQDAGISVVVDLCDTEESRDPKRIRSRIETMVPHIVHFLTHGSIENGDFVLELETSRRNLWPATEIRQFFDELAVKPRLIVLNSCNSARRDARSTRLSSLLLQAGVPAVIGAPAALQIGFARLFSENFYSALANGKTVDKAVASARRALSQTGQYGGLDRRHWALPVLAVTAAVDSLLGFTPANQDMKRCEIAQVAFKRPGAFVDRAADRWSMLSAFCPAVAADRHFRGIILSGSSKVGKSWLMMRAMRDFIDADFVVRYAQLVGPEPSRTSLDVLEQWRGRPGLQSPVMRELPAANFAAFDRALSTARAQGGLTAGNMDDVLRTFKAGLQGYRNDRKVLLVLGRFRERGKSCVSSTDFREHLLEKLLLPIRSVEPVDPETAGIYGLLIVREHPESGQTLDFDEFGLDRLSDNIPELIRKPVNGFMRLSVGEFARDEVDRHFDEFTQFTEGDDVLTSLRGAIKAKTRTTATWSPKLLESYEPLVAGQLP